MIYVYLPSSDIYRMQIIDLFCGVCAILYFFSVRALNAERSSFNIRQGASTKCHMHLQRVAINIHKFLIFMLFVTNRY